MSQEKEDLTVIIVVVVVVLLIVAGLACYFLRPNEDELRKVSINPISGSREDTVDPEQGEVMQVRVGPSTEEMNQIVQMIDLLENKKPV